MTFKAKKHQEVSLKFLKNTKGALDLSDCGTGKTFVEIMDFKQRHAKDKKAMLVLCPKSIMWAAWHNDIKKFAPTLKVCLCYAKNRDDFEKVEADVYVVNIDGVKDLTKHKPSWFKKKFSTLVIDESTAVKHHTSARSKAAAKIAKHFEYRRLLTGTPTSNGICDIWHQAFLVDDGERLGKTFYGFRSAVCVPKQVGPSAQHIQWVDRPGVETQVMALLKDIVVRHRAEDCGDLPENHRYSVSFRLSPTHLKTYKTIKDESFLALGDTTVTAVHGGALAQKLLQVSSGAVYNDDGGYSPIASDRYELVCELIEQRSHSVCFYMWEHQLEELVKEAKKRKLSYAIWDSDKPHLETQFQNGEFQVLFAHPQSAAHGLTLTRGEATIWPSPTHNLEHFLQGLKRVHRMGQTKKTETIVVLAEDTDDEKVYARMGEKNVKMLDLFEAIRDG